MKMNLARLSPQPHKTQLQLQQKLNALESALAALTLREDQIATLNQLQLLHDPISQLQSTLKGMLDTVSAKSADKLHRSGHPEQMMEKSIDHIVQNTHSLNKKIQTLSEEQSRRDRSFQEEKNRHFAEFYKELDKECDSIEIKLHEKINSIKQNRFGVGFYQNTAKQFLKGNKEVEKKVNKFWGYIGMLRSMQLGSRDQQVKQRILNHRDNGKKNKVHLFGKRKQSSALQEDHQLERNIQLEYCEEQMERINLEIESRHETLMKKIEQMQKAIEQSQNNDQIEEGFRKIYMQNEMLTHQASGCFKEFQNELDLLEEGERSWRQRKTSHMAQNARILAAKSKVRTMGQRWKELNGKVFFYLNQL